MQNTKTCTHIKISGVRCGSPSLRGAHFCYYHQRMHCGVRTPPHSRLHPIACIEDKESIQAALMEVINALLRNRLDMKRATLILRALHIAVKNAALVGVKAQASSMVREIPQYKETTGTHAANGLFDLEVPFEAVFGQDPRAAKPQRCYKTSEQFARERDETIANYYGYPTAEAYAAAQAAKNKAASTPPPAQPTAKDAAKPASAPAPTARSATQLPAHEFKKSPAPPQATQSSPASSSANSGAVHAPRKPPTPVKEALANVNKMKGGLHAQR